MSTCRFPPSLAVPMPDINASRSILYLSQVRATAALLDALAQRDECVSLICEPGLSTAALLDPAENALSEHRLRCVRVYGPGWGGLALRDLIAQIVGRADPDALTDDDLKAGFVTLTEPGEDYDRVVLLVTEAQNLQLPALHYIQFAYLSSPRLRIVLAGQPSLRAILAKPAFAQLRHCITSAFELPGPLQDEALGLVPAMLKPLPAPVAVGRSGQTPLVRIGLLVALALLIAAIGWRHMPAPSVSAAHADAPAFNQVTVIRAAPQMPIRDVPVAQPEAPFAEQERADAIEKELAQVFPPELDPPAEATPALAENSLIEQAPASPIDASSVSVHEPSGNPVGQAEYDTVIRDAAPVASMPVDAMALEPDNEASVWPVPDATPLSPQLRLLAAAVHSIDASRARGARGSVKPAAVGAAAPGRSTDGRHCRDIVLNVQLGKDLSDADKQFLRDDCRAK